MDTKKIISWGTVPAIVLVTAAILLVQKRGDETMQPENRIEEGIENTDIPQRETGEQPGASPVSVRPPVLQPDKTPPAPRAQSALPPAVTAPPAETRPPVAAAESDERPTQPPGLNEPEIPVTETAQFLDLVRKTLSDAGPQASEMGQELLDADDPKLRQLGAIILAEQAALETSILKHVAADASPTVPLNTLGWVLDSGGLEQAEQLIGLLVDRGLETDGLMELLAGDELTESGSRAALDLLDASLGAEAKADVFGTISEDAAYAYSVRMKATTLLRNTMEFEDYRNYVQRVEQNSSDQDALWKEGIERLSASLDGPAQIHDGPAILTPSDIDEMLAREYPMILEDLAQRIEYVLKQEDAYIKPGTADRLASRVEELKNRPWASTQQISLRRLESAVALLPNAESVGTPPPSNYLPPPPEFEE